MAAALIIVSLSLLAVVYGQAVGLACMQKERVEKKVEQCFAPLLGTDTRTLKFTDGSLAQVGNLLNEQTCRDENAIVEGLDCFYDFWGDCFNIRSVLPSRHNLKEAIAEACDNVKYLENSCVKPMVRDMTVCLFKNIQKRQMDIITKKVKVESTAQEACKAYTYEKRCLQVSPPICPEASRAAFINFVSKLVPHTCSHPGLMDILKDNSRVKSLGLTRMNYGPR